MILAIKLQHKLELVTACNLNPPWVYDINSYISLDKNGKIEGETILKAGELTLTNYVLQNFSIRPVFVHILKRMAAKLYEEFSNTRLLEIVKCLEIAKITIGY